MDANTALLGIESIQGKIAKFDLKELLFVVES